MAETILVVLGRIPNTDTLNVKKSGIKVNKQGFIQVNDYLETSVKGIWAIGDIIGKYLLKHSANLEVDYATHNAFNQKNKVKVSYKAMPHAIFTSPQIAGVGTTEQELIKAKIKYYKGIYYYKNTAMGEAIQDKDGFVKVLANKKGHILGCHIIGSQASSIIHEAIVAMKNDITIDQLIDTIHIHPALPEVLHRAFASVDFS